MADATEVFHRLQEFLDGLPAGPLRHEIRARLLDALIPCWDFFTGSDVERMAVRKLDRMEEPTWNPPVLTFIIERHGGTVLGSVYGDLQEWRVNMETRVAECETVRRRQLHPKQAAVNVESIADDLTRLILTGAEDERLRRLRDGRVQVLTGVVFPPGPRQTFEGRRKRLQAALEKRLAAHGWERRGSYWQFRPSPR